MQDFYTKHQRLLYYSCYTFLLAFFAYFTALSYDESYYWTWSQQLSWGYFDHPPMVAFLIKIGYTFFQNEFGVRLVFILLHIATIFLIEKIISPKNFHLFIAVVGGCSLFLLANFLATPDIPLLFFAALFFYLYKKFLAEPSWLLSIAIGIVIGALFLSKYHAIVLVVCVIAANVSLLKNKYFYLATIIAALVFMPHVYWQFQHDFPTINYHFFERSSAPFAIVNVLAYIAFQPLILSLLSLFFLPKIAMKKYDTILDKTMKFTLFGFLIFFFAMSFKGWVEGHWTLIVAIPYIVLMYGFIEENFEKYFRWIKIFAIANVLLILLVKFELITGVVAQKIKIENDFYNAKKWANAINEKCKNGTVVFMNSYQKAGRYSFYGHDFALSLNNLSGRKNQYNIWNTDSLIERQPIYLFPNYDVGFTDFVSVGNEKIFYKKYDTFYSYNRIVFQPENNKIKASPNLEIAVNVVLKNPQNKPIKSLTELTPKITLHIFQGKKWVSYFNTEITIQDSLCEKSIAIPIKLPQEKGKYKAYVGVAVGFLPPTFNSKPISITVE